VPVDAVEQHRRARARRGARLAQRAAAGLRAAGRAATTVEIPATGHASPSDKRHYQHRYRASAPGSSPCGCGFNLTNGLTIVWS